MQLDDRCVDILEEGFDLALRIGNPQSCCLVARHLMPIERWVCAAPAYPAERGTPRTPAELLAHDCPRYNNLSAREEWTFGGPEGTQTIEVQGRFCSNNGEVLREAAEQGLGVGALPDFLVAEGLETGRLVRLLEGYQPPALALFALYPTRQFLPTKVRLFLDHLSAHIQSGARSTAPASPKGPWRGLLWDEGGECWVRRPHMGSP